MKSSGNTRLAIFILTVITCVYGTAIAENPDKAKGGKKKPVVIELIPTKMPVYEGKVFTDDDKKFHSYLTTHWPDKAQVLKDLEQDAKAYQKKFRDTKVSLRRLWKGYRSNPIYGQYLVKEVKLRLIRIDILKKYLTAKTKQQKNKLYADLTNIVSKEFDITVTIKKYNYYQLRRRIKRMKNELARRENEVIELVKRKDSEVKKTIEDLINPENENISPVSQIVIPAKKDNTVNKNNAVVIELIPTKMPDFKDRVFTDDEKRFHSWLTTFWVDEAQDLKDLKKNTKEYLDKFGHFRNRFVRLWKGYKLDPVNGQYLVEEVKLRLKKREILDKYLTAQTKEKKAKLLTDLTNTASKEFDIAVTIKKHKYDQLRKRIDDLTKNLTKRESEVKELAQQKDQAIKKRVDELIKAEEDKQKVENSNKKN